MNDPKWLKAMARSKSVDDWIVTSLQSELVVEAVKYAFCTKAKKGDVIVVAILKSHKSQEKRADDARA